MDGRTRQADASGFGLGFLDRCRERLGAAGGQRVGEGLPDGQVLGLERGQQFGVRARGRESSAGTPAACSRLACLASDSAARTG